MSEVHDMSYYQKCMMGGILSCGITHTMVCPLDIVKCRMQVSHHKVYKFYSSPKFLKNFMYFILRIFIEQECFLF